VQAEVNREAERLQQRAGRVQAKKFTEITAQAEAGAVNRLHHRAAEAANIRAAAVLLPKAEREGLLQAVLPALAVTEGAEAVQVLRLVVQEVHPAAAVLLLQAAAVVAEAAAAEGVNKS